jgi:hypothetical protein
MRTDGQTNREKDVKKLMVTFINFANVRKNCNKIHVCALMLIQNYFFLDGQEKVLTVEDHSVSGVWQSFRI